MLGYDLRAAAAYSKQSFPSNALLKFAVEVAKMIAVKFVRLTIQDAAKSLGLSLSDEELNILAEIAVTSVAS